MTKTEKELNCDLLPHHCYSSRLTVHLQEKTSTETRLVEQALNNKTAQKFQQETKHELAHNTITKLQMSGLL